MSVVPYTRYVSLEPILLGDLAILMLTMFVVVFIGMFVPQHLLSMLYFFGTFHYFVMLCIYATMYMPSVCLELEFLLSIKRPILTYGIRVYMRF